MTKITTEDCKLFLQQQYPDLVAKLWKRIKKYKNEQGVWCRDFEHGSGLSITLLELNGVLQLGDTIDLNITAPVLDENSPVLYYKSFDPSLVKKGAKIVKKYVDEYYENEINSELSGYETIPNSVVFFFNNVSDPDMKMKGSLETDFSISIYPNYGQFTNHIEGLIGDFLPDYLSEACECEFTPWFDSDNDVLTASQIMDDLLKRGFVYDTRECSLNEKYSAYKVIPKIEIVIKDTALESEVLDAIKKDNVQVLESLLDSKKIPVNYFVKNTSILYTAFKNDKIECFKAILKRIPNLADYDNSKKNVIDEIYSGYNTKMPHKLKYLDIIINEANMDFSNKKKNEQFALINSLLYLKTKDGNITETIDTNNFKNDILSLKTKFSDYQYGEMILFLVLIHYPASLCEEFLQTACQFIDTYKQDAISLAIEVGLYQGYGFDETMNEKIFDKLVEYNLNIGERTLVDFVNLQINRNPSFIVQKIFRDKDGNKVIKEINPQTQLDTWKRYLKKCK